jgi:predicted nucleic acid-binding protein
VTLILDAAPLVALADRADRMFEPVRQALEADKGPLVIPAPISAEVDYLLGSRHGDLARRRFLADLAEGRFEVACLEREEYATVASLDASYADLGLGLADCAIVVLAGRLKTRRLLSFDERHFRAVRPLQGTAFELLPADS